MSTKSKKKTGQPANGGPNAAQAQLLQLKFQQAIAHHQEGALPQAEALYEEILKSQPKHFDVLHLAGVIASQNDDHAKAVDLISRAIAVHPHNPAFYSNRGVSLQALRQLDAAVASYDAAIRLKPDYALAHFNRGVSLQQLGLADAAVLSFDHAVKHKPDYAEAYLSRGNALKELHRPDAAIASYDLAIGIRPDYAEAWSNRGLSLQLLQQPEAAIASYDRAIAIVGDYAEAHYNRSNVLRELKQYAAAVAGYERAIAIRPDYAEAWFNRGAAHKEQGALPAAIADFEQAILLRPTYAEAHYNLGVVYKELNLLDEALESGDRAIALQPDYPEALWNKSLALLLAGRMAEGWALYEWRWINQKTGQIRRGFRQPLWLGEASLQGKTILLHSEQGLGDTIQFSRYAQQVTDLGARVLLEIQAPLGKLLHALPGVAQIIIRGEPLPDFDFHTPLLSLPLALKTTLQSIPMSGPYLQSDPRKRADWTARLGAHPGPRVGLAWSGNADHANDHHRSVSLHALLQALPAGPQYVSLQKELREADRATMASHPEVMHFGDALDDFTDTAALCDLMDVVISVDTSVAHLSGALGKPTWVLLPFAPDWRWLLDRSDSPWYDAVQLYRQPAIDDWQTVLADVGTALKKR